MQKQIKKQIHFQKQGWVLLCLLVMCAQSAMAQEKTFGEKAKPVVKQLQFGYTLTMESADRMFYTPAPPKAFGYKSGFGMGIAFFGKCNISDKFAVNFLTEGAYRLGAFNTISMGKTIDRNLRLIDLNIIPQLEYRPIEWLGVYLGAKNIINLDEFRKNENDVFQSYRKFTPPANTLIFAMPYELHGQIGLKGYIGKGFIDISYLHGLTNDTNFQATDENGAEVAPLLNRSRGVRLAMGGYF